MRNLVIVTLLLTGGMALAGETSNIIEMYLDESCADEACTQVNTDEILLSSTDKGLELQITKMRGDSKACSYKGLGEYNESTGLFQSKVEYTEWDNVNHMSWKRTCEVFVEQVEGSAQVWSQGRCEKFCENSSETLDTDWIVGW